MSEIRSSQNRCLIQKHFCRMQICWTLTWDSWKGWHWGRFETIPVTTVNSTLAVHAITLLALCYLPGCIGAWIQIFRGTKYSRFPNWLDKWLKMRKQLGLLMLFSASLHVSTYLYSLFFKFRYSEKTTKV